MLQSEAKTEKPWPLVTRRTGNKIEIVKDVVMPDQPIPNLPTDLAETYRRVWSHPAYRNYAPGERSVDGMIAELSPRVGASFIDFGCGTGRPAQELAKRGYRVLAVDFADNCLDNMVDVPFLVADLTKLPGLSAQFGYCTDVMEHIEPERVGDVLAGIARCVRGAVYFAISTVDDAFGPALEGKQLHLTVRKATWWTEKMAAYWPIIDIVATSDIECHIVARKYPKGFLENAEGLVNTACNTSVDIILDHVKTNAHRADVKWLCECEAHDRHAVLVGGGPSLKNHLAEIKRRQDDPNSKQDIVALNGAAKFLLQNGITPDYLLMVDPRERNLDFVRTLQRPRAFLIAAQCHPKVFDHLAGEDVMTFLMYLPEIDARKNELLPKGTRCTPVIGPTSAGLTAMSVMVAAGYRSLHLYGYDSSDEESAAHAYLQELSSAESKRLAVNRLGKTYSCSYAMYEQATTFPEFARMIADFGATITVHGSGLLPDIAREMAANQGE